MTLNEHLCNVLVNEGEYTGIPVVDDFNDEYKIVLYDTRSRMPYALSDIAFGFTPEFVQQSEEYYFLDSTGYKDRENAVKYLVAISLEGGSKAVADALNSSGFSYTCWKPRRDNKAVVHVTVTNGRRYDLVVYRKK